MSLPHAEFTYKIINLGRRLLRVEDRINSPLMKVVHDCDLWFSKWHADGRRSVVVVVYSHWTYSSKSKTGPYPAPPPGKIVRWWSSPLPPFISADKRKRIVKVQCDVMWKTGSTVLNASPWRELPDVHGNQEVHRRFRFTSSGPGPDVIS